MADALALAPADAADGGGGAPSPKRARVEPPGQPHAPVLRPEVTSLAAAAALAPAYAAAAPFPHAVLEGVADPARLAAARAEIIAHVAATYKETDLFKMFQTGDLGNLDALRGAAAARLPALAALKADLFSPRFRAFVEALTGCGPLADRVDCACNVHAAGGHLLCHDDVIGSRRVSFILYLTDPDIEWTAADGGALELYPQAPGAPGEPDVAPAAAVLPRWNRLALFTVAPGVSFHAIGEVLAGGAPRMSIQGWLHAAAPPLRAAAAATLRRLQARPRAGDAGGEFAPLDGAGLPTAADLEFLAGFVNATYLDPAAWPAVAARFAEGGSVQLRDFLGAGWAARVAAATAAADAAARLGGGRAPGFGAGACGGWAAVGPAYKQRYLRYEGAADAAAASGGGSEEAAAAAAAGALLAALRDALFGSPALARLLRALTTVGLVGGRAEARRFRPGLDYTVAHCGAMTPDPQLDAVLCFVADAPDAWGAGEVGGFEAYVLADDEGEGEGGEGEGEEEGQNPKSADERAEVYRRDDGDGDDAGGVLNVSAAPNALNLVLRDEGLMRFVKYVGAAAPGSRWDVAACYLPEPDSSSDEEGGGGGGGGGGRA